MNVVYYYIRAKAVKASKSLSFSIKIVPNTVEEN